MSGGSYNYLCYSTDLADLTEKRIYLEEMAQTLAGMPDAADAARETRAIISDLRAADIRVQVACKRLSGVWKAIEWWTDADWGEERVHQALAVYRGGAGHDRHTYQLTPEEAAVIDAMRNRTEPTP